MRTTPIAKPRVRIAMTASQMAYAAMGVATLAVLFGYANSIPFWSDELCQITFSGTAESWRKAMLYDPHTPPLYDVALFFWYRIAPYGERWLLLLSEAAFAGTVFLTGIVGERIRNRRTGLLAAAFLALNGSALLACGWELRPQAFMLFFSTLSLCEWVARAKRPGFSVSRMLRSAAWMIFNGYSHYFGVLFSGMLFLLDCLLVRKKKADVRYLLSYALAVLAYVPWLRLILGGEETGLWQPAPSLRGVLELLRFLSGQNVLLLGLFALAVVFSVAKGLGALPKVNRVEIAPVFIACGMILLVFLYGKTVAWRSTLWTNRYFSSIFPCVMLACALAFDSLLRALLRHKRKATAVATACLLLFAGFCAVLVIRGEATSPYRAAAEWLYAQEDMFDTDAVVISSDGGWPLDGWNEYYITKQRTRAPIRLADAWAIEPDELLRYNTVYHSTYGYWGLPESLGEVFENQYTLLGENRSLYIKVYEKRN